MPRAINRPTRSATTGAVTMKRSGVNRRNFAPSAAKNAAAASSDNEAALQGISIDTAASAANTKNAR